MANIRAVFFKEADHWVGQCLEYDIGAQASDLDTARSRLKAAIDVERKISLELTGEAFKGIDPAPQYFQDMWERRSRTFEAPPTENESVIVDYALCA
jgi:hypothetical protein